MEYFNPDEFTKLENAVKQQALRSDEDAVDNLSALKKAAMLFAEYVFKVSEERIELRFAQSMLKGDEYRSVVEHFDGTRHTAHEQAIVHARLLNRIASTFGIGNIYLGNPENRREIGEFCLEFTSWLFGNRYS